MVLNQGNVGVPGIEDTMLVLVLNGHPDFQGGSQHFPVFFTLREQAAVS